MAKRLTQDEKDQTIQDLADEVEEAVKGKGLSIGLVANWFTPKGPYNQITVGVRRELQNRGHRLAL